MLAGRNDGKQLTRRCVVQVQLLKRHETAVVLLDEVQEELDKVGFIFRQCGLLGMLLTLEEV